MKSQHFEKEYIYPKCWNEDDINKFKIYMYQACLLHPKLDKAYIELTVEYQINFEKGLVSELPETKEIKIESLQYEELFYEQEVCN